MTESLISRTQSHIVKPSVAVSAESAVRTKTSAESPALAETVASAEAHPPRTAFAAMVDEASDALGLDATEEEKQRLGHWIIGAWEDKLACAACDKDDDATLACAMRTLVRENGIIRSAAARCERYYQAQARRRTARLFGASHLGEHFAGRTFDTFEVDDGNRTAYEACRTLADTFTQGRRGILIAGGCGCGKTHLAAAIVHALIAQGLRPLFMTSERLLFALKDAFGDRERTRAIREELTTADLLVLDDLGAEHMSDWAQSELGSIINDRYEAGKTIILTTNLTLSALTARLGSRTISRIAEMTDGVRITSGDRRLRRHTERRTP